MYKWHDCRRRRSFNHRRDGSCRDMIWRHNRHNRRRHVNNWRNNSRRWNHRIRAWLMNNDDFRRLLVMNNLRRRCRAASRSVRLEDGMNGMFKAQNRSSAYTRDCRFFSQCAKGGSARVERLPMFPAERLSHVVFSERVLDVSFDAHIGFIVIEGLQQMAGKCQRNAADNCRRRQDGPPGRRCCRACGEGSYRCCFSRECKPGTHSRVESEREDFTACNSAMLLEHHQRALRTGNDKVSISRFLEADAVYGSYIIIGGRFRPLFRRRVLRYEACLRIIGDDLTVSTHLEPVLAKGNNALWTVGEWCAVFIIFPARETFNHDV